MLVEPERPPYELTTQSLDDRRTRSARS